MKLNWLHKFNVTRDVKSKQEEKTVNEKGEEVTVKRDVVKKVPFTFSIRKPNRKLYEAGELHYAVKISEGVKAGLLTKPLLAKRYKNDGGPLSDPEKRRYAELYLEFLRYQSELEKLKLNLENLDSETRTDLASEVLTQLTTIKQELVEYEQVQTSLFDQTAEVKAKNQTIMWWVLHLAYQKNEGSSEYSPVFGESEDLESKLAIYDALEEEEDLFWTEVIKKFAYFTTFWYTNGISSEEQFKEVENIFNRDNGVEEEVREEVLKAEVAPEAKVEAKVEAKAVAPAVENKEVAVEAGVGA